MVIQYMYIFISERKNAGECDKIDENKKMATNKLQLLYSYLSRLHKVKMNARQNAKESEQIHRKHNVNCNILISLEQI